MPKKPKNKIKKYRVSMDAERYALYLEEQGEENFEEAARVREEAKEHEQQSE